MVFTLIIGLFIISVLYLSQSVNCGHNISAWASFVFCHNYLLYMGFYGFLMSVPFCFLVLGYGWRHRSQLSLNRIIILYLLFAIICFCHIFLLLCWYCAGFLSVPYFIKQPKSAVRFALTVTSAYLVMFVYLLTSTRGLPRGNWSWHSKWTYFFQIRSIVYFTDTHMIVVIGWSLLFGRMFWLII